MIINDELIGKVTAEAEASPRLRMNYNLHDSLDAKAQRLINVLLPGTPLDTSLQTHRRNLRYSPWQNVCGIL